MRPGWVEPRPLSASRSTAHGIRVCPMLILIRLLYMYICYVWLAVAAGRACVLLL